MPNPRLVSLFIILFIIFSFPDTPPSPLGGHHHLDEAVTKERAALELLNNTHYGDFDAHKEHWLNLTGLKQEDNFAWISLEQVKARAKEQAIHILGHDEASKALDGNAAGQIPLYRNVTGRVRGKWVRSETESSVKRPRLNLTALLPADAHFDRPFERNITGHSGNLRFEFAEKGKTESYSGILVQDVRADVLIADETSAGDGWSIVLYGQHFVDTGHIILTTSSEKYAVLNDVKYIQTD
jgi:mitofusin